MSVINFVLPGNGISENSVTSNSIVVGSLSNITISHVWIVSPFLDLVERMLWFGLNVFPNFLLAGYVNLGDGSGTYVGGAGAIKDEWRLVNAT